MRLYDLRNDLDVRRLCTRIEADRRNGRVVGYETKTTRTLGQNRYLHLVIGVVAMETGNTIAYTKEKYFKRLVNPDLFVVEKEDRFLGKVQLLRSSKDLTIPEMSTAIDKFRQWAAENGIYIPDAADEQRLRELEIEMSRMQRWL